MLSLLVLVPLAFVVLLNLPPKRRMVGVALGLGILLSLLQIVMVLLRPAGFWDVSPDPVSSFVAFRFVVDPLSMILLLSVGLVVFVSLFVARGVLKDSPELFDFVNLILIAMIGMNATVMVADLFSLYVFIEVTAIASFILIAFKRDGNALEGAFKYLVLSAVASVLMLSSVGILLLVSGDTSFAVVRDALMISPMSAYVKIGIGLYLLGLFIKSGLVPFHGWLPDAYSAAPHPTSILLAGIITKTTGVYVLMRLVISVFGVNGPVQNVLMFVGALSIVIGALAALGQADFKRLLAYSSISQVGYIILALGCGSPLAIAGAAFHIFNHAIFKSLLFANAASVEESLKTVKINEMEGLASKMPLTSVASMVGFLSTAGIPPLSGFWSKVIIIIALWTSGNYAYAVVALLASLLTLAYFLLMQRKVFFCMPAAGGQEVREAGFWFAFPQAALAVITVLVGVFFPLVLNRFILAVENILR